MWSEVRERSFFGPAKIKDAEEGVAQVRENLRIAQSQQKSYEDKGEETLSLKLGTTFISKSPHYEAPSGSM